MHIHSPSEHTYNRKQRDLELHIVHRSIDGSELAVLSINFDIVKGGNLKNEFIESLRLDVEDATAKSIPLT